jgi:hypothetical protein
MSITFSSCFYKIHSKYDVSLYIEWMNNFISIVNNFNLVIYTDEKSIEHINTQHNSKIKVIIKPMEQFYNYKYKDYWIKNHEKNILLKNKTCWELNMLWSEKVWFVNETANNKYYDTEFYGWCDIGYFRNRINDSNTSCLLNWSNEKKISLLTKEKIHYGCINTNKRFITQLHKLVNNKNNVGLPQNQIPTNQKSISGGFFILHNKLMPWWAKTYDNKLESYFKNNYLVKDDQIILVDCIFSNTNMFNLFTEKLFYDNWFMFQRILM